LLLLRRKGWETLLLTTTSTRHGCGKWGKANIVRRRGKTFTSRRRM
jgi:hypothetical protein